MISLEETELMAYSARRAERLDLEKFDKLNTSANKLRTDISKLQGDLKITRSVRKADKEISAAETIEDLKKRAKEFYQSKMSYIYCPKCNMLLGTVWVLYTEDRKNKITLHCNRTDSYGNKCDETVTVTIKDVIDTHGTNNVDITPESML
jgi:NAD-dependent SIR2 family protein deacetylase